MGKGRLLSRFGMIALTAAMLLTAVAMPKAQAAAKRAPNVLGTWHFFLNSQVLEEYLVEIIVETQNQKNGKITGNGSSADGEFTFKGKIQPNGKLKSSIKTQFGENPVTIDIKVKVARDGLTAEGTYTVTGHGGVPIDEGTVEGDKQVE